MSQNEKKTWRSLSRLAKVSIILLTVALLTMGVVFGKYVWERTSNGAGVTSDSFYFTVDILGDSQMKENESGSYSFTESQSGAWNLYSGIEHTVTLNVQNFNDNNRISKQQISYTATVAVTSPDGQATSIDGLTLKNGDTDIKGGATQTIGATSETGTKTTQTLTLNIPAYSATNAYTDGTKVKVTIKSTAPYEKTIELEFTLYTMQTGLFYKIVDAPNTPYAELVLINAMLEQNMTVKPFIVWPIGLSIDNTNELTYKRGDGVNADKNSFIQQSGIEDRNMQISRSLRARESVSIYFFKEDQTKDYTVAQTEVELVNGKYTITINEPTK